MFNQRLALRHALTCHGQRQGDGGEETFWHIGDNDPNAENRADPKAQPRQQSNGEKRRAHRQ